MKSFRMIKKSSSFLFFLYKVLFLFISFPIFIDFHSMSFFLIPVEEYSFDNRPSIPFPVGAIALLLATVVGYILYFVNPRKMKVMFQPLQLAVFVLFFSIPFGVYALFVSGLSVARFIQVILPALLLSILSFPADLKDRISILRYFLFGAGVWFFLHFISIMIDSEDVFHINDRLEFSSFYGYLVYQALVSYPGVIAILLFFSLSIIFRQFSRSPLVRRKWLTWWCVLLAFVLMYLGFAAGRRAFIVEMMTGTTLVALSIFLYCLMNKTVSIRSLISSFLFCTFFSLSFFIYFQSDLSSRLVASVERGTFDSGRVDILIHALIFFSQNPSILFFGAGGSDAPGFHNFFLDQMYRVGLIGVLVAYVTTAYLLHRFYKMNDIYNSFRHAQVTFFLLVLSSLFWQSMINASISQPYYLVNVIAVISLVVFVVFCKDSPVKER